MSNASRALDSIRRMRRIRHLAAAVLVYTGACGDSTGPSQAKLEPLRTDSTHYAARYLKGSGPYRIYGFTIVARFVNVRTDTVFITRGDRDFARPTYRVFLADDTARRPTGYDRIWTCCEGAPIVVPPRASRIDTVLIQGPNMWDGITHAPIGALEGSFRLSYYVRYCRAEDGCETLPAERTSNSFVVGVEWLSADASTNGIAEPSGRGGFSLQRSRSAR